MDSPPLKGGGAYSFATGGDDLENAVPPGCLPSKSASASSRPIAAKKPIAAKQPAAARSPLGSPKLAAVAASPSSVPAVGGGIANSPPIKKTTAVAQSPAIAPTAAAAAAAAAAPAGSSPAVARSGADFYERMLNSGIDPFGQSGAADGGAAASSKPLSARVTDKNWKVRKEACEEIIGLAKNTPSGEEGDKLASEWASALPALVKDSNAATQEKAAELLVALFTLSQCREITDTAIGLLPICIDKGLTGRTIFKNASTELCFLVVEAGEVAPCIAALKEGCDHKNPKTAAAAARLLFDIFKAFGARVVSPKPDILKTLPVLFDHGDPAVRGAAQDLTLEVYRWIRGAIKPSLKDIKPVQLKELEDLFAKEDEAGSAKPVPTRFTRADQAKIAAGELDPTGASAAAAGKGAAADDDDIMGPTDVLSKIKAAWFTEIESTKWQDRKAALGTLIQLADVTGKIAQGDFGNIFRAVRKVIKDDSNINVVTTAVQALGLLARGLGSGFSNHSRNVIAILLDKFKDKNKPTVMACQVALANMFRSLTIGELLEDFNTAAVHKVPKVKVELFTLLATCFETGVFADKDVKKSLKDVTAIISAKGIADGVVEVRDAATKAMSALAALVGASAVSPLLADIEPSRLALILGGSSASAAASSSSSSSSAPAASAPAATSSAKTSAASSSSAAAKPAAAKTSSSSAAASSSSSKSAASSSGAAAAASSSSAASAKDKDSGFSSEEFNPSMSGDSAVEKLDGLVGEATIKALKSSNWKERLDSFDKFEAKFDTPEVCSDFAEALILAIEKITGGKEGNFQVNRRMLQLYIKVITTASQVPRRVISVLVPVLINKIQDAKTRDNSREGLTAASEVTHPSFVTLLITREAQNQKNPKVIIELLTWLSEAVTEFGVAAFVSQIKVIVDLLRNSLDHSNAAVRSEALKVISSLGGNQKVGQSIKSKLSDLKPAILGNIEDALSKSPVTEPAPTRTARTDVPQRRVAAGDKPGVGAAGGAGAEIDVLDELNPRVDISTKLTPELMAQLAETGKDNWKSKQEALEALAKIIADTGNRIQPKVGELPMPLKKLLTDVNKNIVAQAAAFVGQLGAAMGPACDKLAKVFLGSLMSCFCDNKTNVRTAVSSALDAWVTQISIVPFFHFAASVLAGPNPTARLETLNWLATHDADIRAVDPKVATKDIAELIKPLVACLQDKNPEIRTAADGVLATVYHVAGAAVFTKEAKTMSQMESGILNAHMKKQPERPSTAPPAAAVAANQTAAAAAAATAAAGLKRPATTPGTPSSKTKSRIPTGQTPRKPGAASAASSAIAAAAPAAAATAAAVPAATPVVKHNDLKDKRRVKNEKGLKWAFEEPEYKFIELCRDQMSQCVSDETVESLFSGDFKHHLVALDTLMTEISRDATFAIEAVDVLFKWVSLRVCEGNIRVILKSLEFLKVVTDALIARAYVLTDYEASCLLPFLVDRLGQNNDSLRKSFRDLLRDLRKVYPASKLFSALVDGLRSKNSRSRVECIEEMGSIAAANGFAVMGAPNKVLPALATYLVDRDVHARTAATGALTEIFNLSSADFWKYLSGIDDKIKEKVEEKFGKAGSSAPVAAAATAAATASAPQASGASAIASVPQGTLKLRKPGEIAAAAAPVAAAPVAAVAPVAVRETVMVSLDDIKDEFGLKMDILETQSKKPVVPLVPEPVFAAELAAPVFAPAAVAVSPVRPFSAVAPVFAAPIETAIPIAAAPVAAVPTAAVSAPKPSILSEPTPTPQSRTLSRIPSMQHESSSSVSAASAVPLSASAAADPVSAIPAISAPFSWKMAIRTAFANPAVDTAKMCDVISYIERMGTPIEREADELATQLSQLGTDCFSQKRENLLIFALDALRRVFFKAGRCVSQPSLVVIERFVLPALVSPQRYHFQAPETIKKALEDTFHAVLDRGDKTMLFSATLSYLRQELTIMRETKVSAETPLVSVILQVLGHKLRTALNDHVHLFNIDHMLLDIDLFFREHPAHRFRGTAVLTTIKSILQTLVTVRKFALRDNMGLIPRDDRTHAVVAYIEAELEKLAGKTSSQPSPSTWKSPTSAASLAPFKAFAPSSSSSSTAAAGAGEPGSLVTASSTVLTNQSKVDEIRSRLEASKRLRNLSFGTAPVAPVAATAASVASVAPSIATTAPVLASSSVPAFASPQPKAHQQPHYVPSAQPQPVQMQQQQQPAAAAPQATAFAFAPHVRQQVVQSQSTSGQPTTPVRAFHPGIAPPAASYIPSPQQQSVSSQSAMVQSILQRAKLASQQQVVSQPQMPPQVVAQPHHGFAGSPMSHHHPVHFPSSPFHHHR